MTCVRCKKRSAREGKATCLVCAQSRQVRKGLYKTEIGGASFEVIGRELGVTSARARQIYMEALAKIMNACEVYGVEPGDLLERRHMLDHAQDMAWSD